MIAMIAATTIRRLAPKATNAASRSATLSCLPTKVISPAIQFTDVLSALSAVKMAAEIATPKDAPSDDASGSSAIARLRAGRTSSDMIPR